MCQVAGEIISPCRDSSLLAIVRSHLRPPRLSPRSPWVAIYHRWSVDGVFEISPCRHWLSGHAPLTPSDLSRIEPHRSRCPLVTNTACSFSSDAHLSNPALSRIEADWIISYCTDCHLRLSCHCPLTLWAGQTVTIVTATASDAFFLHNGNYKSISVTTEWLVKTQRARVKQTTIEGYGKFNSRFFQIKDRTKLDYTIFLVQPVQLHPPLQSEHSL